MPRIKHTHTHTHPSLHPYTGAGPAIQEQTHSKLYPFAGDDQNLTYSNQAVQIPVDLEPRQGAAPAKTSTGNNFPRTYQRISTCCKGGWQKGAGHSFSVRSLLGNLFLSCGHILVSLFGHFLVTCLPPPFSAQ